MSASEALYGRSLHVPFEVISPMENDREPFVKALNEYISEIHPTIMAHQYKKYAEFIRHDTGNAPVLKLGSKALIWKPSIESGKLSKSWAGPYVIRKRLGKDTYQLHCPKEKRNFRRHVRHLRPLHPGVNPDGPEPELPNEESENEKDEFDKQLIFPFAYYPE